MWEKGNKKENVVVKEQNEQKGGQSLLKREKDHLG